MFADEYYPVKIKNDDVVFDVGANIGLSVINFSHKGAKNIVAIEPEPQNFKMLKLNCTSNNINAKLLNVAVSNKSGIVHFGSTGGTASVKNDGISVNAMSLDDIVSRLNVGPTIVKMDIEGYEVNALNGFKQGISTVKQFIIETHSPELENDVVQILRQQGFKITRVNYKLSKIGLRILRHFYSFIDIEKKYNFQKSKVAFKFIFGIGISPYIHTETSNTNIIYAFR